MNPKEQLFKDLSRVLAERVSSVTGDVCQLLDTDEEKLAVLIVSLSSMFAATMELTADVIPSYRKLDPVTRCIAMNSVLAQAHLTVDQLKRPITHPGLPTALNDITNALQRTVL